MDAEHGQVDANAGGSALADLLEQHERLILERFRTQAARLPGAGARLELEARLIPFLDALIAALRQPPPSDEEARKLDETERSRTNGEPSFFAPVDVRRVVREHELLQELIYELIEEEGLPVDASELRLLARAVADDIGAAADASARHHEEELAACKQRLERLTRSERARLEQEHAERVALEQELLAIMSHDLRNPLSAILMTADWLLKGGNLDPELTRSLERVRASGTRAAELIEDLLDYTRARLGGGIPIKPATARLHAIVRTVVEEARLTHPARRIEHEPEGDDAGFWDARRLKQVVAHLVAAALQQSPRDSAVRVRSYGRGEQVGLEVHHEGRSIPPELQAHLFEPIPRGPVRDRRRLGLGLYIASRVVAAHGGQIAVESDEERGTTFRVTLPRHRP